MKTRLLRRTPFLLGFSAALGAVLALSVVAFASADGATSSDPATPADATSVVSSFSRARTSEDVLSPLASRALERLVAVAAPSDALNPGLPEPSRSRRVTATADGGARGIVYLVPTSKKQVCYVITPSGQAGCSDGTGLVRDGVEWGLFDSDGIGVGSPTIVHGLVATNVTGLAIDADGKTTAATINDGAFYTEMAGTPESITLTLSDGTQREIGVPVPPK